MCVRYWWKFVTSGRLDLVLLGNVKVRKLEEDCVHKHRGRELVFIRYLLLWQHSALLLLIVTHAVSYLLLLLC